MKPLRPRVTRSAHDHTTTRRRRRAYLSALCLPVSALLAMALGFALLPHVLAHDSAPHNRQIMPTPTFPIGVNPANPPQAAPPVDLPPAVPTPTFAGGVTLNPQPTRMSLPDPGPDQGIDSLPALPTAAPAPADAPASLPVIEPQPLPALDNTPKFLSLPFPEDPRIHLLQGWYYDSKGLHQGLDYFRIEDNWNFTGFPIMAAADGYACADGDYGAEPENPDAAIPDPATTPTPQHQHRPIPKPDDWMDDPKMVAPWEDDPRRGAPDENTDAEVTPAPREHDPSWGYCVAGFGKRVLIRHEVEGQVYYTYYGHLETIAQEIPAGSRGTTVWVERGQVIGYAGNTGTGGGTPHLHFGLATPGFGWLDPYDLWTTHEVYPDTNATNGRFSGPNHFWTTNPPSHRAIPRQLPEGYVVRPTHSAVVVGTVDIHGWSRVPDGDIKSVEIWIDGELRGVADYGMWHDNPLGDYGFLWEWDTTRERNGEHIVEVKAFSQEDESALLLSGGNVHEEAFPVVVQNPEGALDQPSFDSVIDGTVDIRGWAFVQNSLIERIEIWIDGRMRGIAEYGLPHEGAQGDYGFRWQWDTTGEEAGLHTIRVRIIAVNGGSKFLSFGGGLNESFLPVTVRRPDAVVPAGIPAAEYGIPPPEWSFPISKWTVR